MTKAPDAMGQDDIEAFGSDLHPVIKKIYLGRGVRDDSEIALRLADLEKPASLRNIDQAVQLLTRALQAQSRILIIGDFDADGATSTALAMLSLKTMGFTQVDFLVPNRFDYGYGLTPEIVDVASTLEPDVIITVDNGISSHEGVERAHHHGIQVLVTDHHLPGEDLPKADCIVNPNQADCAFPSKALAGVGVVFYLMSALRASLRQQGWFARQQLAEPNMATFLDIVALGTVADVVPLDANNRRLVKHGLNIIRGGRGRPGILALLEVAGKSPQNVVAGDLGFAAGPRLNAAGRLDDMSLGIACLLADDEATARSIALQLDGLNKDRKSIEMDMQAQALAVLDGISLDAGHGQLGICLYDAQWHQGVIGILASRIKDRFHRPVIIFADGGTDTQDDGPIKGSARSIAGLHIRDLLDRIATRHPALLQKFGGHAMAAGLTIRHADFDAFCQAYQQALADVLDKTLLEPQLITDGSLDASCFSIEFAQLLRDAGPWGQGFAEPRFQGAFRVISQRLLAEKHLKLVLALPQTGEVIDAIAFNVSAQDWQAPVSEVALVYRLELNEFRGTVSPQLLIEKITVLEPGKRRA
ncbi:MAG: single-stranded-DNA-specific exonuclease RecJ [Pseudomonadales bacterium]|nr:single-stranded-DNA-specific exonuclease RecJ [Pseudomonadales bacterium]